MPNRSLRRRFAGQSRARNHKWQTMQSASASQSPSETGTGIISRGGVGIGLTQDWGQMEKSTLRLFGLFWTRLNTNRQFSKARRLTRIGIK